MDEWTRLDEAREQIEGNKNFSEIIKTNMKLKERGKLEERKMDRHRWKQNICLISKK